MSVGAKTLFPLLVARNILHYTGHFPMDADWVGEYASDMYIVLTLRSQKSESTIVRKTAD
jgi:hypothetical protein